MTVYPGAREAGGSFVGTAPVVSSTGVRGQAADPERSRVEAGRRARGRLRRYCAANRLNRFGTLTYAGQGCHDPRLLRADLSEFFRRVRDALGGRPIPYVWVPEWHKTDHGLHAHFAFARYVHRSILVEAWGRGFVHIKLLGDLPVGSGTLGEARRAAGYLSKYVAKSFGDDDRPAGLHRYDLAQGFAPKAVRLQGGSPNSVLGKASALLGAEPSRLWSSAQSEDWSGAAAIWAQWA